MVMMYQIDEANKHKIMEIICSLLKSSSTKEEHIQNANIIITYFNLDFSPEQINEIFLKVRQYDEYYAVPLYDKRYVNLFYLLLTTNLKMFAALAYAIMHDKINAAKLFNLVWDHCNNTFSLGFWNPSRENRDSIYETICIMQMYCSFDITNLYFRDTDRNYIQEKLSGRTTKSAIKKKNEV